MLHIRRRALKFGTICPLLSHWKSCFPSAFTKRPNSVPVSKYNFRSARIRGLESLRPDHSAKAERREDWQEDAKFGHSEPAFDIGQRLAAHRDAPSQFGRADSLGSPQFGDAQPYRLVNAAETYLRRG